jgi:hypothetical protein
LPFKHTQHKDIDRIDLNLMGPDGQGQTADKDMAQVLQAIMDKLGLGDMISPGPLKGLLGR